MTDSPSPHVPKPSTRSPIERAVDTVCDIAANGLPIGKDARIVAKIEDMNHGEYKAKPSAVVGISFEF